MQLHIIISADNAAFGECTADRNIELVSILNHQVVDALIHEKKMPVILRDSNGNAVGSMYETI